MKKTSSKAPSNVGFPEVITNLPQAQTICEGSKAWILQGESTQLVFFEFQKGGKVKDHSHSYAQWGLVVDGKMELIVDGKSKIYGKGDEYLVPAGLIHCAWFPCKTRLMDLFCEKERYKPK